MRVQCKQCGKEFSRSGRPVFCSVTCKADWQRAEKERLGIARAWLHQKYVIEQLGTCAIGKLVGRNAKRVYVWLKDYGIPLRDRHSAAVIANKREDVRRRRAASSRGRCVGAVTREKISKARAGKEQPNLRGARNGMYERTGALHPGWRGGVTPERQRHYSKRVWKVAEKRVRERDGAVCRVCGCQHYGERQFPVHHLFDFYSDVSARDVVNCLVIVCWKCHRKLHNMDDLGRSLFEEQLKARKEVR